MEINNFINFNPMNNNNMAINSGLDKNMLINSLEQNTQLANQIIINNNMIKTIVKNYNSQSNIENRIYEIDLFPKYDEQRINIKFMGDMQFIIHAPLNAPIKDMLTAAFIKMQIIGIAKNMNIYKIKDYNFIFNGHSLSLDENKTILEVGISNMSTIIIKDKYGLIGG